MESSAALLIVASITLNYFSLIAAQTVSKRVFMMTSDDNIARYSMESLQRPENVIITFKKQRERRTVINSTSYT